MDMIHFLGTDTHRSRSVYTEMNIISKKLIKLIGKDKFDILSTINPKKILENQEV